MKKKDANATKTHYVMTSNKLQLLPGDDTFKFWDTPAGAPMLQPRQEKNVD